MKSFILYILFLTHAWGESALQKKYPHGLLTDDYGIINERDLLVDVEDAKPTPYRINEFQPAYRR